MTKEKYIAEWSLLQGKIDTLTAELDELDPSTPEWYWTWGERDALEAEQLELAYQFSNQYTIQE